MKLEGENFAFYVLLLQLQTLQRLAITILTFFQIVIVFEMPTKSCLEIVNAFHLFAIPPQYLLEECPNVHFRLILFPNLWVIVNDTALTNHIDNFYFNFVQLSSTTKCWLKRSLISQFSEQVQYLSSLSIPPCLSSNRGI